MKVSIPKEEIDQLMKEYQCSEAQAIKAYLDAKEVSRVSFEDELRRQLGPKKEDEKWRVPILTPREIKTHLDKYVIGQEEYKKRLSIAAAFHFAILRLLDESTEDVSVKRFRKKNTIIAGPSGSGKTYCAEVLGDLLEVPTLIVDATDYTEAGYVGKSADDMIRELIDVAPGHSRQEQAEFVNRYGGIIFIDEIDKKAKDRNLIGHDISREGFQRAVLKLIERKFVPIDNPMSPASHFKETLIKGSDKDPRKQKNMLSTERILFIVGGSFQRPHNDLESIVKDRIKHEGGRIREDGSFMVTGFGSNGQGKKTRTIENSYKEANVEDYIRFGLIPELVGRIPIRSHVNLLSKNDLVRIMRDTEDSIIQQYILEFKAFGIDLKIDESAIFYVAEKGENQKTGARALVSVWETILTGFQFELPGSHFKELVVGEELCRMPKDALLNMLKRSPFLDYIESFKREYGIELEINDEVETYVEKYAEDNNMEISAALKQLLKSASTLNYMNIKGKFAITVPMLEDNNYFNSLFTAWYQDQQVQQAPASSGGGGVI